MINKNLSNESERQEFYERIQRHMFILKKYESRTATVTTGFNPFYVPGFPVLFHDPNDSGLVFCGQLMTVDHQFGKNGGSTTLQIAFVRTLDDQLKLPIENSYQEISQKLTHDVGKMSEVYADLLGVSEATAWDNTWEQEHDNPLAAYQANARNICTLQDYLSFMGLSAGAMTQDDLGVEIPTVINGSFVNNRNDTQLRDKLQTVAEDLEEHFIYMSP